MANRYSIMVGAIPIRDDQVLLLQRGEREKFMPGAWGLPAGKIDFGEDLKAAVLREFREEAGLSGEVGRLCGYSMFLSQKDGDELHNLQVNFVVAVGEGEVVLDRANQAYKWIALSAYQEAGLDEFTTATLAQYFE